MLFFSLFAVLTSSTLLVKDSRTGETREAGFKDGKRSCCQEPCEEKGGVAKSHGESRKVKSLNPFTMTWFCNGRLGSLLTWTCSCDVAASHLKDSVRASAPLYKGSWIGRRANTRTKRCAQVTPHRLCTESAAPSLPLWACPLPRGRQRQTRPRRRAHRISLRSRTICFSFQREGKHRTFSNVAMEFSRNQALFHSENPRVYV